MSSAENTWGTLINSDKSPAPLLVQLCLAIAQLIPTFDKNGTTDITPDRLATFYQKVGGNYDSLFLETKTQALSFIYQSLGCFHSLQPSPNPYEPPSIPSLLPNGFVRWQTIQLLMDPDEHSVYLQNAMSLWDLADSDGHPFPKTIPRDAFPAKPDKEMLEWHEGVSRRLEHDYVARHAKRASPTDFGTYHYHFSGKDPLPEEDDQFSGRSRRKASSRHGNAEPGPSSGHRHSMKDPLPEEYAEFDRPPPRMASKRHSHAEPDRPSGNRHHRRHHSGDYPPVSGRRPLKTRSGYSTPRVSSPPAWGEHPPRSGGRDQSAAYGRPESPGAKEPGISDASSEEEELPQPPERSNSHRHYEKRNLSPPSSNHARRHSHEAYMRRPFRDRSPGPERQHHSHETHKSGYSRSHPEISPKYRERSRSRTPGVKFREFIFGDRIPTPVAPDPPLYRPSTPPPPRAVPRHLGPYAAEDMRRGSYSGGSTPSRPSSGGSGSERPRSYSNAGSRRPKGWASPRNEKSSAAKRYTPPSVPGDRGYSRRATIYE